MTTETKLPDIEIDNNYFQFDPSIGRSFVQQIKDEIIFSKAEIRDYRITGNDKNPKYRKELAKVRCRIAYLQKMIPKIEEIQKPTEW